MLEIARIKAYVCSYAPPERAAPRYPILRYLYSILVQYLYVTLLYLFMVLYLGRMCQCGLQAELWLHSGILMSRLAAEPRSTTWFLFPSHCPSGTICWSRTRWCVTGGFHEQRQSFFVGLRCSIPTIVFYSFSLSLLSVYRLLLWGWGLRTDRVYITLSQPCTADLF